MKLLPGNFLMVQWLGRCAHTADQVQSLVGELRSHKPPFATHPPLKKKKTASYLIITNYILGLPWWLRG